MVSAGKAAGVAFGVNHHQPSHTTHAEIRWRTVPIDLEPPIQEVAP